MKNPKIINIALCSSGKVYSGGERCLVELIKQFEAFGYEQEVFVSHNEDGSELNEGSKTKVFYALAGIDYAKTKTSAFIKYLLTFLSGLRFLKRYKEDVVIISHSEMWPDVLFSSLLNLINPQAKRLAFIHALLPQHKYDDSSFFVRAHNTINQWLFLVFQRGAKGIVTVNPNFLDLLKKHNKNILVLKLGKEKPWKPETKFEDRDIDLCFLGRFFDYKGIWEIPEMMESLISVTDRKLKFVLMGKKNQMSEKLKVLLELYKDKVDFEFMGFVRGSEKHRILSRTKVFVFPSFTESFGLVYLDAISNGTPVVEYDLPCFVMHERGVIKVPFKDNKAFGEALGKVINDKSLFEKLSNDGINYAREFDWTAAAKTLEEFLND